jgi:hypothetical protein
MGNLRNKSARYIARILCGFFASFWLSPAFSADQLPVYRFLGNNVHLYTLSYLEGSSAGYPYEVIAFSVLPTRLDANMLAAYRCREGGSGHFVSTSANCEGQIMEGTLGWISDIPRDGFVPLYRFFGGVDHLITTNYSEGAAVGYRFEGTIGYVPPTVTTEQKPISSFYTQVGSLFLPGYTDNTPVLRSSIVFLPNFAFMLFKYQQDSDMTTLYRCGSAPNFLSTNPACEDANVGGEAIGWLSKTPRQGYTPLYRLVKSFIDHVSTVDYAKAVAAGYSLEGILGYVPTSQKPLFRFLRAASTDHFLTPSFSEVTASNSQTTPENGYRFEHIGFKVFTSQQDPSMHLLYRCLMGTDHFVSTRSDCEGQKFEGAYGWVANESRAGFIPVYRFFKGRDHLETTSYGEGTSNNYRFEHIVGYAPL